MEELEKEREAVTLDDLLVKKSSCIVYSVFSIIYFNIYLCYVHVHVHVNQHVYVCMYSYTAKLVYTFEKVGVE